MAEVEVVYAKSFYAGAKHTSGKWSGEIMAILAGPDPSGNVETDSPLPWDTSNKSYRVLRDETTPSHFPPFISRTGSY